VDQYIDGKRRPDARSTVEELRENDNALAMMITAGG
jgi:hypothetical protein